MGLKVEDVMEVKRNGHDKEEERYSLPFRRSHMMETAREDEEDICAHTKIDKGNAHRDSNSGDI